MSYLSCKLARINYVIRHIKTSKKLEFILLVVFFEDVFGELLEILGKIYKENENTAEIEKDFLVQRIEKMLEELS